MSKWENLLAKGYQDIRDLQEILHLDKSELNKLMEIQERFPMFVNPYYLSLINPEDPNDPIRKMCIPTDMELDTGGTMDTSGELDNTVVPGMQHKYAQTVLVLSTNQCAMYCRHCFRKRLVGLTSDETNGHIPDMVQYVREHKEVTNVLISGGDAFLNSNRTLQKYLEFADIDHIDLIRFGTRTPVVLPQRIDKKLIEVLREFAGKKRIYVVTQFNHPREVTSEAAKAVQMLLDTGIIVKNQTVLLKGINDTPEVLSALLKKIVSIGIIPYYIFQCRPVQGVYSQFQVPLRTGYRIIEDTKNLCNGQEKCFRYAMSHPEGKIEILGELENKDMLFKFHQAKYSKNAGKILTVKVTEAQCWLPEQF